MTTIITRLYSTESAAQAVVAALDAAGVAAESITVLTSADTGAMMAARVPQARAAGYASHMTGGQALVVAAVGFNPVGAVRKAIKIMDRTASLAGADDYIVEYPDAVMKNNLLAGNPLVMSNSYSKPPHGHIFGANPVMSSPTKTSAMRGTRHMSRAFWPMKLVATPECKSSAWAGGGLMSSMFGLPTLIRR
jgi:hypothetical protein